MLSIPPLWGGTLDSIEIDLLRQRVMIEAHVVNSRNDPAESHHVLEINDVSDFRWFSEIPGPWSYAELTEIHVTRSSDSEILLEIILWSEDAGLSITAKSARLDGEEMVADA